MRGEGRVAARAHGRDGRTGAVELHLAAIGAPLDRDDTDQPFGRPGERFCRSRPHRMRRTAPAASSALRPSTWRRRHRRHTQATGSARVTVLVTVDRSSSVSAASSAGSAGCCSRSCSHPRPSTAQAARLGRVHPRAVCAPSLVLSGSAGALPRTGWVWEVCWGGASRLYPPSGPVSAYFSADLTLLAAVQWLEG